MFLPLLAFTASPALAQEGVKTEGFSPEATSTPPAADAPAPTAEDQPIWARDGLGWGGFPFANYSSDDGLGFGILGSLDWNPQVYLDVKNLW